MTIRIFKDIDDPFLKKEWERLQQEGDIFPQSSYHWCATWWKHLRGRRTLHIVMALDDKGRVVAIAPLCIEHSFGFPILRSMPVNYCDFFQIVICPRADTYAVFETIYRYLMRFEQWAAVLLAPVNDHNTLAEFLCAKGTAKKQLVGNVVADISASNWDHYLGTVSRNRRRLTKKKMQAFEARHKIEIEFITDEQGYLSFFDRIHEIQELRATKDRAARSPEYMQCVRECNGKLFAEGRMGLYLIKADNVVISYRIGILQSTTYYDWNTSYDITYSEYSPGLIGLAYVIRDLISRKFTTLDFMAGVYDYKLSYSPKHEMRNNLLFILKDSSFAASIYCKYYLEWRDVLKNKYYKTKKNLTEFHHFLDKHRKSSRQFFQDSGQRIRQYGLPATVLQLTKAAIRPLYQENRNLVFIIPDFFGYSFSDSNIFRMSHERVEKALATGELDQTQAALLTGFLDVGCIGLCAEVEGKLAGYAWMQLTGEYSFGRTGRMPIPPQVALFKNLFVLPGYRSMCLGQKLNAARLALVPPGYTPMVFIIPDNRYAIRNWEKLGFQKVIMIKRWQWRQSGTWRMHLTRLADLSVTVPLLQALEASGDA